MEVKSPNIVNLVWTNKFISEVNKDYAKKVVGSQQKKQCPNKFFWLVTNWDLVSALNFSVSKTNLQQQQI